MNLKNLSAILIFLTALSCTTNPEFMIEGKAENMDGNKILLKKSVGYSYEAVDSTIVEDGVFSFKGSIELPDIYAISVQGISGSKKICLENDEFRVEINEKLTESPVTGGSYQSLMDDFTLEMGDLDTKERELINKIWRDPDIDEEGKKALYPVLEEVRKNKINLANSYIEENPGSPHTPQVLNIYIRNFLNIDELDSVYQTFTDEVKNSNIGVRLGKSIAGVRRSEIGKPMIDFSMPGVDGEEVKLSDIVARNKMVFIDFWASWCGPCRASIPELKEVYKEYRPQGLEMLAVSYDDNRENWVNAINDEGFEWINASNLSGWNCPTALQYAIRGIPASILIDADGNIAARSLRGQQLRDKIEELLLAP